ncbi:MAG: class I SAM-dependent methyltransferase [Roseibium sp.]|uniref:class I SAM-dependent methyltransferase n=1 Tax=Roseibium sp. TaxID=1936156 RepID=UPI0026301C42|nr:class I SAM-dependent methyltransferase [Roseibium sp.]MCV0429031.1 class I SAM-dependent methyltransferase [Roseibium sp.]
MGHSQVRLLSAARTVLAHLHEALELQFGFELWDGSLIPENAPADGLRIAISEAALTRLLRRPGIKTVIDLYSTADIDPRGGTIFEFAEKRPKVKGREVRKRLSKRLLLKNALPLLRGVRSNPESRQEDGNDAGKGADRSSGSRKDDIAFHYDVSNDFYRLFLDPKMVYTCAYFTDWDNDLATAQTDKLDMICRKLRLKPGDRMLDIGCGWGALICHAAEHYGVTAVGVTLAEEQLKLARENIAARNLEDKVSVELIDYRHMDGKFDKISSIGMFEAVGLDNYDNYFQSVHRLLKPRGLYLHHAITRRGKKDLKAFRRKKPEYQALVRYIFPGGEVDHIGWTLTNLEAHGFEVHDVEAWREHYARTTRLWAENLMQVKDAAIAEVGSQKYRLWLAYLCGVSLGFHRGTIGIFQTVTSKRTKGPSGMPPTRKHLYRR